MKALNRLVSLWAQRPKFFCRKIEDNDEKKSASAHSKDQMGIYWLSQLEIPINAF